MCDYRDFKGGMQGKNATAIAEYRPHFEEATQDRKASCEMRSESQNFKIYKATRLLLLK